MQACALLVGLLILLLVIYILVRGNQLLKGLVIGIVLGVLFMLFAASNFVTEPHSW